MLSSAVIFSRATSSLLMQFARNMQHKLPLGQFWSSWFYVMLMEINWSGVTRLAQNATNLTALINTWAVFRSSIYMLEILQRQRKLHRTCEWCLKDSEVSLMPQDINQMYPINREYVRLPTSLKQYMEYTFLTWWITMPLSVDVLSIYFDC